MRTVYFICLPLLIMAWAGQVLALHKIDHRYTVSGTVRDAAGLPQAGAEVVLEHKTGSVGQKQKVKADSSGYYKALFHLHNDNEGDEMTVAFGSEVKRIVVAFDPNDVATSRAAVVDFGAPARESNWRWLYWGGAVVVMGGLFYLARKGKKKAPLRKRGKKEKVGTSTASEV
jgi:LPXTG-motif cell wall-anchored protein